ncbi:hypothetical protein ACFC26_15985 [Kitasatospora purpeofusca]|uniref:hypothetical protein n=1 Tax=Kitasatospora purpeofusca TaxID=67352 RepID=UPI0035E1C25A
MTTPLTAAEWNARYPVGTPVTAYPGVRPEYAASIGLTDYTRLETHTRTPAWTLGDGEPVVSVDGYAGGISLQHIDLREESGPASQPQPAPLDLDAIQARHTDSVDPSACGTCRQLAAAGQQIAHACGRRATLIAAPDAPCYETILDVPEDQRARLPARFHTPVFDDAGSRKVWMCAVCWGDGWGTSWPCATAVEYGAEVFTPEHLAVRARTDVPALVARVRELETELVDVQKAQTGDRVHPRHWDLFAENAAPDAIRAHLDVARADQRNAARYTTRLELLLATREQQPAT